jgi:hypothetical protein
VTRLLVGLALFCAGLLAGAWGQSARLTPRMQARQDTLAYQRGVNETLREQLARRVAEIDTVEIPRWRVLRDSAQTILTDTAKYGLAIRALDVADSTISSCRRVLGDCLALTDSLRAQVATGERQLADALRLGRPPLLLLEGGYRPTDGTVRIGVDGSMGLGDDWRGYVKAEHRFGFGADTARSDIEVGVRRPIRLF